jgi:hypothetical protein
MDTEFGPPATHNAPSEVMGPGWANAVCAAAATTRALGLGDATVEACQKAVASHVETYLAVRSKREFGSRVLGPALRYAATVPLGFLELVMPEEVGWTGDLFVCSCFLCFALLNFSFSRRSTNTALLPTRKMIRHCVSQRA